MYGFGNGLKTYQRSLPVSQSSIFKCTFLTFHGHNCVLLVIIVIAFFHHTVFLFIETTVNHSLPVVKQPNLWFCCMNCAVCLKSVCLLLVTSSTSKCALTLTEYKLRKSKKVGEHDQHYSAANGDLSHSALICW